MMNVGVCARAHHEQKKHLHPQRRNVSTCWFALICTLCVSPQVVAQMSNHGVDADSAACLLLGSLSPEGGWCHAHAALHAC